MKGPGISQIMIEYMKFNIAILIKHPMAATAKDHAVPPKRNN